jgi:predicted ArsR family transcriptional regulator
VPSLQEQARALGDPTRYAIFRFIVDADDPVDVAALTDAFAFNHNAIRQHLAKLVDAELVVEETAARTGRGRPRLVYQPHPRADSRWGATGPYERLALLLSEMVRTGDAPEVVGHRAGVAAVGEFAPGTDAVDVVAGFMERNGFEPTVTTRGSRVEVVLDTCPFASAALGFARRARTRDRRRSGGGDHGRRTRPQGSLSGGLPAAHANCRQTLIQETSSSRRCRKRRSGSLGV